MKKLTILMPVKNVDSFFPLTLQSINNQTFQDFILFIICNEEVASDVEQVLSSMSLKFNYEILKTRLNGVAFAANLGISNVKTEYTARWDADDLCDSNRFTLQIAELDKDPSIAIIGTKVKHIDENGVIDEFHPFRFYGDDKSIRKALRYRQPFLHSSLIFRTDILFSVKGYLNGHHSEDHELFIRIARNKNVKFMNIESSTTYYRRHSKQLSDASNQYDFFIDVSAFMFAEFLRSWNFIYLIGAAANIPLFRRTRHFARKIRRIINFK